MDNLVCLFAQIIIRLSTETNVNLHVKMAISFQAMVNLAKSFAP